MSPEPPSSTSSSPTSSFVLPVGTTRSRSLWIVVTMTLTGRHAFLRDCPASGEPEPMSTQVRNLVASPSTIHFLKAGKETQAVSPYDVGRGDGPDNLALGIEHRHPALGRRGDGIDCNVEMSRFGHRGCRYIHE